MVHNESFLINGTIEEECVVIEDKNGCHMIQEEDRFLRLGETAGDQQAPFHSKDRLVYLPPADLSQEQILVLENRAGSCKDEFKWNIILYGYQAGAEKYLKCLDKKVLETVDEEVEEAKKESIVPKDSGSTSFLSYLLLMVMIGAITAF
jgi:hypothetical protein